MPVIWCYIAIADPKWRSDGGYVRSQQSYTYLVEGCCSCYCCCCWTHSPPQAQNNQGLTQMCFCWLGTQCMQGVCKGYSERETHPFTFIVNSFFVYSKTFDLTHFCPQNSVTTFFNVFFIRLDNTMNFVSLCYIL